MGHGAEPSLGFFELPILFSQLPVNTVVIGDCILDPLETKVGKTEHLCLTSHHTYQGIGRCEDFHKFFRPASRAKKTGMQIIARLPELSTRLTGMIPPAYFEALKLFLALVPLKEHQSFFGYNSRSARIPAELIWIAFTASKSDEGYMEDIMQVRLRSNRGCLAP